MSGGLGERLAPGWRSAGGAGEPWLYSSDSSFFDDFAVLSVGEEESLP